MTVRRRNGGFTLVEIAIVLFIVGLLTRTLITPITAVQQRKLYDITSAQLQLVKDSLLAHVVARGFLPCPIGIGALPHLENAGGTSCSIKEGGVPAVLLGLSGSIDSHGSLLDSWNRPYRYAVSLNNHKSQGDQRLPDWTTLGEASNVGIRHLSSSLVLCTKSSTAACVNKNTRADNIAFVVLSLGKDDSTNGTQLENQDDDDTFVINSLSLSNDAPFDDQVVWSSTQDVVYWMLRSAWLP